jgi:hypothetical protein
VLRVSLFAVLVAVALAADASHALRFYVNDFLALSALNSYIVRVLLRSPRRIAPPRDYYHYSVVAGLQSLG